MSETAAIFSLIIALIKMGVFSALFAVSIVLVRVSKLKELLFFSLAALSFMLSSLFELVNTMPFLDSAFVILNQTTARLVAKLFLSIAAIFLFLFFYYVYKNLKNYV